VKYPALAISIGVLLVLIAFVLSWLVPASHSLNHLVRGMK
jgi:hypothetical protein